MAIVEMATSQKYDLSFDEVVKRVFTPNIKDSEKELLLQYLYNRAYNQGYNEGYDDGYSAKVHDNKGKLYEIKKK